MRDDVREIKAAAERAGALTRQILAFSRRQALRPRVVSLNDVLDGLEPLLRRTLGEDIQLVSRQDPNLGLVEVDQHQFEQVLINLAVNARDAMPAGGRLTFATTNIELDDDTRGIHPDATPGSYVLLSVADTGVGMDQETASHVFEPFFTTKPAGQGTGLGLSTVYGIVLQSGGSIDVCTEPGVGSIFRVLLPRIEAPAVVSDTHDVEGSSIGGEESVLVVEDDEALRHLVCRVLAPYGYDLTATGGADQALALLADETRRVDLLLTDIVLAGSIRGDVLAQRALILRPALRVLYMSGYARDAMAHSGRVDESADFLAKPFSPEALAKKVREVLDGPPGSAL